MVALPATRIAFTVAIAATLGTGPAEPADASSTPSHELAFTCDGQPATIVGTIGRDILTGTAGDDVIVARGGNDVIRGLGGNDVLCGGFGDDRLEAGPGDDRLFGDKKRDTLEGGSGDDYLDGGVDRTYNTATWIGATSGLVIDSTTGTATSPDETDTFRSIDVIIGSTFDDMITIAAPHGYGYGLAGDDKIRAAGGLDNLIDGGPGSDRLIGSLGVDQLYGDDGDDFLNGRGGSDDGDGGDGFDHCKHIEDPHWCEAKAVPEADGAFSAPQLRDVRTANERRRTTAGIGNRPTRGQ